MNDALLRLGWDDGWATHVTADDDIARVVIEHRGAYEVTGNGGTGWAELTGRRFREARDKRDLPAVGDWLVVDRWASAVAGQGAAVIKTILPRRSLIVRRAAGEKGVPQTIAANVDVAFVVTSANLELSPRRLERYLAVARDAGVTPVLLLSKADLVDDPAALLAQITDVAAGAEVIATSATRGDGVAQLRARLGTGTGVLLGSSGVGKSTLLNGLLGDDQQATAAISADAQRGRHTTTRRAMFVLPGGGVIIDTPGMRELAAWADSPEDTTAQDAQVRELAQTCKFADCTHTTEPNCSVRAAVAAGTIDQARVAHSKLLAGERAESARRHDILTRRAESRQSKLAMRRKPPDQA